jgi:hypothetical protein
VSFPLEQKDRNHHHRVEAVWNTVDNGLLTRKTPIQKITASHSQCMVCLFEEKVLQISDYKVQSHIRKYQIKAPKI